MSQLGLEVLDMFLPQGVDLLKTCTHKKNRVPVIMAGAGILLFAIAYAKIDWLGSEDTPAAGEPDEDLPAVMNKEEYL